MNYYRIWGAQIGLFPAWTDYGWIYGSPQRVSELFGYLLEAGRGANYMFAVYDTNNAPVVPIMPQRGGNAGGGLQLPGGWTVPGLTMPGAS